MKIEYTSIDDLAKRKKELETERKVNKSNSLKKSLKLKTKIQSLVNKLDKNNSECNLRNAEIDRELKRIIKLIELERQHANYIAEKENVKGKKR